AERALAKLLLAKGVIDAREYDQTIAALTATSTAPAAAHIVPTVYVTDAPATNVAKDQLNSTGIAKSSDADHAKIAHAPTAQPQSAEPKVVPAVAPLRLLPITIPKKEGLVPDLKLGSGASLRPYGFFK